MTFLKLFKKGPSSEACVFGMVKIGGAPRSSGCGMLMVSAVDPSGAQLPSARFLTAYGVASTPIALGSAVAHEGTERAPLEDEMARQQNAPGPRILKEVVVTEETVARSRRWLIISILEFADFST